MKTIGKILWYDSKYKKGVIVDSQSNEYYFDISVVESRKETGLVASRLVVFEIDKSLKHLMTAKNVLIPTSKIRASLEKQFINSVKDIAA